MGQIYRKVDQKRERKKYWGAIKYKENEEQNI